MDINMCEVYSTSSTVQDCLVYCTCSSVQHCTVYSTCGTLQECTAYYTVYTVHAVQYKTVYCRELQIKFNWEAGPTRTPSVRLNIKYNRIIIIIS